MQLTPVQTYKKIQAKGGHRWPVGICFFGYRAASGLSTGCSAAHFEKGQFKGCNQIKTVATPWENLLTRCFNAFYRVCVWFGQKVSSQGEAL
ncbi:hypothetical protein [Pseudomonas sp. ME-P-057]|jgi:hypothetical protein|uniref:hypothetical protein n=1 Tax=Pseudomonas sp. ME-P-057 TaxID=3040321 RepID=UPI00255339C9|nr:hypothetical protein [Pseudomonas sp. ME-P-057]